MIVEHLRSLANWYETNWWGCPLTIPKQVDYGRLTGLWATLASSCRSTRLELGWRTPCWRHHKDHGLHHHQRPHHHHHFKNLLVLIFIFKHQRWLSHHFLYRSHRRLPIRKRSPSVIVIASLIVIILNLLLSSVQWFITSPVDCNEYLPIRKRSPSVMQKLLK